VQYEFGFGLSYTTFNLTGLHITSLSSATAPLPALPPASAPILPGGNAALFETLYTITTRVTNTGACRGAAVPQLYLALPRIPGSVTTTPPRVLRGFEKVMLEAGEARDLRAKGEFMPVVGGSAA
jgi:beta-glucosidase